MRMPIWVFALCLLAVGGAGVVGGAENFGPAPATAAPLSNDGTMAPATTMRNPQADDSDNDEAAAPDDSDGDLLPQPRGHVHLGPGNDGVVIET